MKFKFGWAMAVSFLLLGAVVASAAMPQTLHSRSGQFIVRGLPLKPSITGPGFQSLPDASQENISYIRLDPAVLVVACERVKQEILAELGLPDQWRGNIQIEVHPVARDNEPVQITSVRYRDGWRYYLRVPELIGRERLVKALVQVLLAEMANRQGKQEAAELPLWLIEGFSGYIQTLSPGILGPNPSTSLASRRVDLDALQPLRELLRHRPALSFDELSWPNEDQLEPASNAAFYQGCATLFVYELLRLKTGPACLGEMIQRLPEHLNWQTTFLKAFHAYFPRLVETAKWWSLSVVQFTGLDPKSAWTFDQTFARFEEILLTPAQMRRNPNDLPEQTTLKLQNLLADWSYARHAPILAQKANQLQALRLRAAPELLSLIDGYLETLFEYLSRRDQTGRLSPHKQQIAPSPRLITRDALKRLNELDTRRRALRDPIRRQQADSRMMDSELSRR